jgi:DNA helicase HerA-like ATPase
MPRKIRPDKAAPSPSIIIGRRMEGERPSAEPVSLPLRTLVMHGMIGGSTGTGKSRAIQLISEKLVEHGVPVILADLKGDISGFIRRNDSKKASERAASMGISFSPSVYPTDFFSISGRFIPFRIRLDSVDPTLLSRILKLNPTQESNLKMAMLYAKGKGLPVRDLADLQTILAYLSKNPGSAAGASPGSINVILRQVGIAMGEGMGSLFGEPQTEIADMLSPKVHILNLSDWRRSSELPSILMGFILYRLFQELDDVGAVDKPRAAIFIDEAHYLFQNANPSLVSLFTTILKQIRSKGVAVFFSTQNPEDLPEKVLEQLGCKIEFALRAFTKEELEDISGIAKSFPPTRMNLAKEIVALQIGEALVSPLDEGGRPLAPMKTMFAPPSSFMDVVPDDMIQKSLDPALMGKYRAKAEPERYELDSGLPRFRVPGDNWHAINAEAARYERKEAKMAGKSWSRLKWAGVFVLLALLLLVILAALATIGILMLK